MRMDDRQPVDGGDPWNGEDAETLAKIFLGIWRERDSRRFARAVVHDRGSEKFENDAAARGLD